MKNLSHLIIAALTLAAAPVQAADNITLQLKWIHQAQFAGYYAAQENGDYAAEGLEVEIRPLTPGEETPPQLAASGAADVVVEWMPAALLARENGTPLVNIAQPFAYSALGLTCLRAAGIRTLNDLRGKRVGHWPGADGMPAYTLLDKLRIPAVQTADAAGGSGVQLRPYANTPAALQAGEVECVSSLAYADPVLFAQAGFPKSDLLVFDYQTLGMATLQDGLYVMQHRLQDPAFVDAMVRFVRASMRGWQWAANNQEAAVQMILRIKGAQGDAKQEELQRHMMREVAKLLSTSNGELSIRDYERTVQLLLNIGTLKQKPQTAWNKSITHRAQN